MIEATCACCTCGYQWSRGQDGSHSCSTELLKQIEVLKAESIDLSKQIQALENNLRFLGTQIIEQGALTEGYEKQLTLISGIVGDGELCDVSTQVCDFVQALSDKMKGQKKIIERIYELVEQEGQDDLARILQGIWDSLNEKAESKLIIRELHDDAERYRFLRDDDKWGDDSGDDTFETLAQSSMCAFDEIVDSRMKKSELEDNQA